MTPAHARAMYARQIAAHGENVTFRRTVANAPAIEKTVRVRVTGYSDAELVAGVSIGDRKIILTAEEAEKTGLPVPLRKGTDAFIVRSTKLTVEAVDDSTRRINGVLIAYEIRASGA